MLIAQGIAFFHHRGAGQIGETAHHQTRGFTAGVGINDVYSFHEEIPLDDFSRRRQGGR